MQRKYPPRIFLSLDMTAAFEFADFQCRSDKPIFKDGKALRLIDMNLMRQLDVWRVRLPDIMVLRRDVLFPGRAGWTDQAIPRGHVSLVCCWRLRRAVWRLMRKAGAV